MKKSLHIKWKVGDIVTIPLGGCLCAYGRVLNDCGIAIYDVVGTRQLPCPDFAQIPIRFTMTVTTSAIESGEWCIVGHVDSQNPDDDWEPPKYLPDVMSPHNPRIYYKGIIRRAAPEDVIGLDVAGLQSPQETVIKIASEFGLHLDLADEQPSRKASAGRRSHHKEWSSFGNDDASDWLVELESVDNWKPFHDALTVAAQTTQYLEAPQARVAVAMDETIAAASGNPAPSLPDEVVDFVSRVRKPTKALVKLAMQALESVASNSELRDLWEESGLFKEWDATIADLQSRLEHATK